MDEKSQQHIYYALGLLAYSAARVDEEIDEEEKKVLYKIITKATDSINASVNFQDMIQHILQKEKRDFESTYNWALYTVKNNRSALTKEIKDQFVYVVNQVIKKFPSNKTFPKTVTDRLKKDLNSL